VQCDIHSMGLKQQKEHHQPAVMPERSNDDGGGLQK
jgi:hypothetical protein